MPAVDAHQRHELYVAMEELIGPDKAETFMSLMPPTTGDELVTKEHLSRELENFELRFEAKLQQELRALTRTLMLGLMTAMAAMTSLCLGAVALSP